MSEKNNTITVTTLLSLYANSLSSTLDGQIMTLERFYFDNQGNVMVSIIMMKSSVRTKKIESQLN